MNGGATFKFLDSQRQVLLGIVHDVKNQPVKEKDAGGKFNDQYIVIPDKLIWNRTCVRLLYFLFSTRP
jgi:hypothetical protein